LTTYPSATIYATVRPSSDAAPLRKLADSSNNRVVVLEVDATDVTSVDKLRETIGKSTSALDQVIYNAGVLKGFSPLTRASIDDFKLNMEVNVYGAHIATIAFYPFVQQSTYKNKVFVLVGSSFGSVNTARENFDMHSNAFGIPGTNPTALYDISKTAEERLLLELDMELRPKGVPMLLVHPGLPKTQLNPFGNITVDESAEGW
jgi:NAD(P)-dependent dehydrogenase (short-subunit alcohol dehydrogenase family)